MTNQVFKFDNYPELLKAYKYWQKLNNKHFKLSLKQNSDATSVYIQINEYTNVFAKQIFETFNGKIELIYHEVEGETKWADVFGSDFNEIDFNKRKCLVGLLDGNFVYRLSPEFYFPDPNLEGYYIKLK